MSRFRMIVIAAIAAAGLAIGAGPIAANAQTPALHNGCSPVISHAPRSGLAMTGTSGRC